MRGANQQQYQAYVTLLKKHGPAIAQAFSEAVHKGARDVSVTALSAAIERGDIERIRVLLKLEPERMFALSEAVRSAFIGSGMAVESFAPIAAEFAFSGTQTIAEQWIVDNGARLVQDISDTAMGVARDVIQEGLRDGHGSAKVARELIGRGKAREGARIGLTRQQSRAVDNTRKNLQELDGEYLTRKWRDKRYDAQVRRAIKEGKPLSVSQIDTITGRYADRAERYRARSIGQVEARRGIAGGQDIAYRQLQDRPNVDSISKRWQWNPGNQQDPRPDHQAISGTVLPNDEPFVFPDGVRFMYPNDPAAPIDHTIWCHCTVFRRVKMAVD